MRMREFGKPIPHWPSAPGPPRSDRPRPSSTLAAPHRAMVHSSGAGRNPRPPLLAIQEMEIMKRILALCALAAVASLVALAGEWQGYVMDSSCAAKMKDKAANHKTKCAISCSKGGYGLVTADGKFVKFDEAGNSKAREA